MAQKAVYQRWSVSQSTVDSGRVPLDTPKRQTVCQQDEQYGPKRYIYQYHRQNGNECFLGSKDYYPRKDPSDSTAPLWLLGNCNGSVEAMVAVGAHDISVELGKSASSKCLVEISPIVSVNVLPPGGWTAPLMWFTITGTRSIETIYSKGSYLNDITADYGSLPSNGKHSDGYWYVFVKMASDLKGNINGTWKDITPFVNINGIWRPCEAKANINGVWR